MKVTVENTQVYAVPAPEMVSLMTSFHEFYTAHRFEEIMDAVRVAVTSEESCVHPGTTNC